MDRHRIFDLGFIGDCRLGVEDQRDIGRGAAHVVGDERRKAGPPPGIGGGDHARSGTGHHGLGGLPRHVARRDHAAIAVHHQEIAQIAAQIQFAGKARHIAFEDRPHAGIHRRRDAALELARFRQERVAGGDMTVRPIFGSDLGGPPLMRRVGIGVQEMDDQGFAAGGQQVLNGVAYLPFVERHAHRARGLEALRHFQPEIARDDGHETAGHAIGLRPGSPPEFDHVAKAARGDHAGAGQPPLQHRIGRRGGAVDDEIDVADREIGIAKCRHHAESLVLGCRRRLGDAHAPAIAAVDQNEIGKRPPNVDAHHDTAGVCRNIL